MSIVAGHSNDRQSVSGVVTRERPRHWDANWRQFAVLRKTATRPRSPLASLAANPRYWRGYRQSWDEWLNAVENQGVDVAFIPALNDVVVLDCDVKTYDGELVIHADNPSLVTISEPVTRRGVDDLAALAVELGREAGELATYAVATKSGGVHLYYALAGRERPRSRHHRDGWRVDVVASANSWVAAPPSPSYRVIRDRPVAVMPDWLYDAVNEINRLRPPLGGRRRRDLDAKLRDLRPLVKTSQRDRGVFETYLWTQCELVRLANATGGWNSTIFEVACDLATLGVRLPAAEDLLTEAAEPWDDKQRSAAAATIASAYAYKLTGYGNGGTSR